MRTWGLMLALAAAAAAASAQQVSKTDFSCRGRNTGYYADVATGCQVYHMCDGLGRQFSYTCPNATLFQQRMLICDHWYMVNCSKAEDDYSANLLIGQKKPFVDDYVRTPRPDLLNPGESEYNIIYRTGRDQTDNIKNVVGVEEPQKPEKASTEEAEYFPPSHWFTEYSDQITTPSSVSENRRILNEQPHKSVSSYYQTNYHTINKNTDDNSRIQAKSINLNSPNKNRNLLPDNKSNSPPTNIGSNSFKINFESSFKATTPVYPKSADITSEAPNEIGIVPPGDSLRNEDEFIINVPHINFESSFKATTPNYPHSVELTSPDPNEVGLMAPEGVTSQNQESSDIHVNFESNFKATTPVYPKSVEATSPNPHNVGLLAPKSSQDEELNDVHVNFESNFKATTPNYPKFVEPTSPEPHEVGVIAPRESEEVRSIVFELSQPKVNFESNFEATTPNYPKTVKPTSPNPSEVGLTAPERNDTSTKTETDSQHKTSVQVVPTLNLEFEPPAFDNSYVQRKDNIQPTGAYPSMFYQPPKFDPDFTINKAIPVPIAANGLFLKPDYTQRMKPEQWNMLREILHIPNYNFPLETVTRPSYESGFNSFQVKSAQKNIN